MDHVGSKGVELTAGNIVEAVVRMTAHTQSPKRASRVQHPANLLPSLHQPFGSPHIGSNERIDDGGYRRRSAQKYRTKHSRPSLQVGHCSAPRHPFASRRRRHVRCFPRPTLSFTHSYPHRSCPCSDNGQNRHIPFCARWNTSRFQTLRWLVISTLVFFVMQDSGLLDRSELESCGKQSFRVVLRPAMTGVSTLSSG